MADKLISLIEQSDNQEPQVMTAAKPPEITEHLLPWTVEAIVPDSFYVDAETPVPITHSDIVDAAGQSVAITVETTTAHRIVRAVSCHDELVAALKALQIQALQSEINSPANEWGFEALELARAALTKAGG